MIQLKGVCRSFVGKGSVLHAVKDVTLNIERGEVFGVIGFSGAGKSTLVRCINLLERPDSGSVIVDGVELTSLSGTRLRAERRKIGMIFQHFNLFKSRTVSENISYSLEHTKNSVRRKIGIVLRRFNLFKSRTVSESISYSLEHAKNSVDKAARVRELLKLVGLLDKANAYPSQLSGGQKQRVGIARSLASNPSVLLCDEATSALDPQTTKSILSLLKDLNKKLGLTIVIITHEMDVIKSVCHKAAVMDNGYVVEHGSVFDIFSNPKEQITKDFIATTSSLHKIYDLIAENSPVVDLKQGEVLAKFSYVGRSTVEALISTASIEFDAHINIIFGDLDIIQDTPFGGMIVILSCKNGVDDLIKWVEQRGVRVEVIKHG